MSMREESISISDECLELTDLLQSRLILLPQSDHIRELRTILRDKSTDHPEFVFCADSLFRLVVEEGLNQLPFHSETIITPLGHEYNGIRFAKGNCGVSVCRSGEAMELALRQCCRSIRIGKILIGEDRGVLYSRLMTDIEKRCVLLLYPILTTGYTASKAVEVLLKDGVDEEKIFLLTVFSTPQSIKFLRADFKKITIITSEICTDVPIFFATQYFGTD